MSMRQIHVKEITEKVVQLCQDANYELGDDMMDVFNESLKQETSTVGRHVLSQLIENANVAKQERVPMCQDTGVGVFFIEVGYECQIIGGDLYEAINEGISKGYREGYLRFSMVNDPLNRINTGDNTPALIYVEMVSGDQLKIKYSAKGAGSENMSRLRMLNPADGLEGVKDFVIETVSKAGPNACPPMVVGVGIGGSFERSTYIAKKSLFRHVGQRHSDERIGALEKELIQKCNELGVGPQGLGGVTTVLDVKIEVFPCHIASLPVAVNIQCHANRHKEAVL
ncbi:fumarate hydratase [Halalkalibacter oceani]|uniref:fumarate hydratase n=1 Tax=Halalkalibacter oceani TaxID=1653776 RepID=UPI003392D604